MGKDFEQKLKNMPIKTNHGWVPHINVVRRACDTILKVAKIPIDSYGQIVDNLFDWTKTNKNECS